MTQRPPAPHGSGVRATGHKHRRTLIKVEEEFEPGRPSSERQQPMSALATGEAAAAADAAAVAIDEAAVTAIALKAQAEVEALLTLTRPARPECDCPTWAGPMECVDRSGAGRGWVATADIPAGSTVLCETPVAFSTDWEAEALGSDAEALDTAALILALVKRLARPDGPAVLEQLQHLTPRPGEPTAVSQWSCADDPALDAKVNKEL